MHLLHREFLAEAAADGLDVHPGGLGENILTEALDLLGLPEGALLRIGAEAAIRVTGLRNPCRQIESFSPGLLTVAVRRDPDGRLERRSGVRGVVETGGVVSPGDPIVVHAPDGDRRPLKPV